MLFIIFRCIPNDLTDQNDPGILCQILFLSSLEKPGPEKISDGLKTDISGHIRSGGNMRINAEDGFAIEDIWRV